MATAAHCCSGGGRSSGIRCPGVHTRALVGTTRRLLELRAYYAVTERGNFEGRNILHTPQPMSAVAAELALTGRQLQQKIDQARAGLYGARARRPAPIRDEKMLTAWSGLMISAFSRGALVLDEGRYLKRAKRAASFVLKHLKKDGRLLRSFKDGRASHNGYLDDYAFLIAGLIDLYEASHELDWLQHAIDLAALVEQHYKDRDEGGYFMTSDDHETLLAREKPSYDGAEPSANSIHVHSLLRLYELTTEEHYREEAESTLKAFGSTLQQSPAALSEMLVAVDFYLDHPKEVVIIAPESTDRAEALLEPLRSQFLPNRVLSVVSEGKMQAAHQQVIPLLEQKVARGGEPTAYVCERGVCQFPTSDPSVLSEQVRQVRRLDATE